MLILLNPNRFWVKDVDTGKRGYMGNVSGFWRRNVCSVVRRGAYDTGNNSNIHAVRERI